MAENKISACLVVYNEEEKIEDCLRSIRDYVDQIVLVHDGECTDRTLEIANKYGCEIYIEKYLGNAEPHRSFSFEKSRNDWILLIDADERLSLGLAEELETLIQDMNVDAYTFDWVSEIGEKGQLFKKKQILLRKNKMYFLGFPHIQVETRGVCKYLPFSLLHDTSEYRSGKKLLASYLRKNKKWGMVTAKMLRSPLEDLSVFNCIINDPNLKQIKKVKLIKNFPLVAIFVVPVYSFFYGMVFCKGFKKGFLGFVSCLHVPLHIFFTCYYLILYKIKLLK